MRYFCTYFDRNYLVKGLALIRSLTRSYGEDVRVYVVCMDEITRLLLGDLNIPQVVTIPLHSIEQGDEALLKTRHDRTPVEYLWTSTPTLILRILERHTEIDLLTYVDADMFVYNSLEPLFEEVGDASVMIHGHRFPQVLAHLERFGLFNVGLLVFRRDERGLAVLRWWRERRLEWCKATLEDNKYGDQKYLDVWPTTFPGVRVTQNIGVGTAPWNHAQYHFHERNGAVSINDTPLAIYHFHAFQILNEAVIIPVGIADYCTPMSYYHHALPPYLAALDEAIVTVRSVDRAFDCGLSKPDFKLTPELGFIIRESELPHFRSATEGLASEALPGGWVLFPGSRTI